jgi:hypothetical protein
MTSLIIRGYIKVISFKIPLKKMKVILFLQIHFKLYRPNSFKHNVHLVNMSTNMFDVSVKFWWSVGKVPILGDVSTSIDVIV